MIRHVMNIAGTVLAALAITTIGTYAYNQGVVAAVSHAWNFRNTAQVIPSPAATVGAGVDVATTPPRSIVYPAPVMVPTAPPSPTPAPAPTVNPLLTECQWSAYIMRTDARSDRAAIATWPDYTDYYNRLAGWWDTIAGWIDAQCAPGWPPARCADARHWIDFGRSTHETTGSVVPHNAAWDATWIANYQRVGRLIAQLCA